MTVPYERTRAVNNTGEFLKELAFSIPRVPKEVRARALILLRHYPEKHDFDLVSSNFKSDVLECPFSKSDSTF